MIDRDQEMMDYIDEHIVGDRTSDAAEDSAGAAWAAYKRGEYDVPDWYRKEYKNRRIISNTIYKRDTSINWDTFLRSMGILFLILLGLSLIITIIGFYPI